MSTKQCYSLFPGMLLIAACLISWQYSAETKLVHWPTSSELAQNRLIGPSAFRGSASFQASPQPSQALAPPEALPEPNPHTLLSFKNLTVKIEEDSEGRLQAQLPKEITNLSGRAVGISGFAYQLGRSPDGANRLILFESQEAAQSGLEPHLDRWMLVESHSSSVYDPSQPVDCYGTLIVEPAVINGQLQCLYRLNDAKVVGQ